MRAKIEINEVEAQTKIRAKYLRAIENEEWDLLPGEVYAKSFLRTYGNYLGLDTRQLLDNFRRQYEAPSDQELRPIAPQGGQRDRGPRGPIVPPWAAVGVVLVVVLVVLYLVGRGGGGPSKPATTTNHVAPRHANRHHQKHRAGAGAFGVGATKVKLQLIPTGQVYVCLVNGKGTPLIPGTIFSPGEKVPVETAGKLLLTLGNAAVHMKVNGVTVPITASAGAIGYELLPGSHHPLPPAQQPRCA